MDYNFYCLAQKYYIGNYIQYACESLAKTFEDSLNNVTKELLKQKDITILIHKCFLKKYNEFEERMQTINNKKALSKNLIDDSSYTSGSKNIIEVPYRNNKNINQNYQQQPTFNRNANNIKDLSDIESVTTIQLPFKDTNSNHSIYSSSKKSSSSKNIDIRSIKTNNVNNYPNFNSNRNINNAYNNIVKNSTKMNYYNNINNNMNINYQMNNQNNMNNQYNKY